jgi:hypothetical protein
MRSSLDSLWLTVAGDMFKALAAETTPLFSTMAIKVSNSLIVYIKRADV